MVARAPVSRVGEYEHAQFEQFGLSLGHMCEVEFLAARVPRDYQSLNDFWHYPVGARVRMLGVHLQKLPRYPWELLIFGQRPVSDALPSATFLSESLLTDAQTRATFQAAFRSCRLHHNRRDAQKRQDIGQPHAGG